MLEEGVEVTTEDEVRVDRHIPGQLALNTEAESLRVGNLDVGIDQHRGVGDGLKDVRPDDAGGGELIEPRLNRRSLLRYDLQRLRGGQLRRQNLKRRGAQRRSPVRSRVDHSEVGNDSGE